MWAATTSQPCQSGLASKPRIWPRRPETRRCTREVKAFGTEMSTWWIGSSSTGSHFGMASLIAMRADRLERLVRAVDGVELAGREIDRDVDHREAERPVLQILDHALLDRGDVVARDGAADDRCR